MPKLTDREKVQFLRHFVQMGHTDGTPFEDATFVLSSGHRPYNFYSMKEILGLVEHLNKMAVLGCPSPSDTFVYHFLKENKVIEALCALAEHENGPSIEKFESDEE